MSPMESIVSIGHESIPMEMPISFREILGKILPMLAKLTRGREWFQWNLSDPLETNRFFWKC